MPRNSKGFLLRQSSRNCFFSILLCFKVVCLIEELQLSPYLRHGIIFVFSAAKKKRWRNLLMYFLEGLATAFLGLFKWNEQTLVGNLYIA
jgi:hypothetical protein